MELTPAQRFQRWAARKQISCFYLKETDSTNTAAKLNLDSIEGPHCWVAEHQTHGRGRLDHTWTDSRGAFLSSWCFDLPGPAQPTFTARMGLATFQTLMTVWPDQPFSIKAPNDIFLSEGKLAGFLIEAISQGATHKVIVGFGMNVETHPSGVGATSLATQGLSLSSLELFWDVLHRNWLAVLQVANRLELTQNERDQLRQALQRHPQMGPSLVGVSANGDLLTSQGLQPWFRI